MGGRSQVEDRQLEGRGSGQVHLEEGQQGQEEVHHSGGRRDRQALLVLPGLEHAAASDEACLDARLLLPLLQEPQELQEVLREPHQLPPRCSSRTLSPGREAGKLGQLLGRKRPAWRAPW